MKRSNRTVEIIRLTKEQSEERAEKRSQDIWPDPARLTAQEALDGLRVWSDPFILSIFRSHHNSKVRRVAESKWRQSLKKAA